MVEAGSLEYLGMTSENLENRDIELTTEFQKKDIFLSSSKKILPARCV